MKIEVMIYIYGAVCVSMIIFNIVYNLLLKRDEQRVKYRSKSLEDKIQIQLERIEKNLKVQEEHLDYLRHTLKRVNNLICFDHALDDILKKQPEIGEKYLHQIQSVILYLAILYKNKEPMQAGYFSYFLSCYCVNRQMPIDSLQEVILEYVKEENFYCKVNGLNALYHFAGVDKIVKAIKIIDDGKIFIHEKIITEGLLSYEGDQKQLMASLWEEKDKFTTHMQLAILNYIRFQSGDYKEKMFTIMQDKKQDKELRLSAIRYFGKYKYETALEPLLAFVVDKDPSHWEFATVAASALSRYSGECVIDALKEALHSGNWYIRYSAAESLEMHNVEYSDLIDVVRGNDRYAREMMTYRLEARSLQKAEV